MRTVLAGLILSLCSAGAAAAQFDGQVDSYLGWRGLKNRDYWIDTADQFTYGLQANFGVDDFPINGEIGILGSARRREYSGGFKVTDEVGEFSIGPLWRPMKHSFVQPYVGFGIASVSAYEKLEDPVFGTADDSDSSAALYAHAGVVFLIARHIDVGIDARFLRGSDITLFGANGDADYDQVTLRVGYAWGTEPRAPRRHERSYREREERAPREREKRESRRGTRRKKIPGSPEPDDAPVGF